MHFAGIFLLYSAMRSFAFEGVDASDDEHQAMDYRVMLYYYENCSSFFFA